MDYLALVKQVIGRLKGWSIANILREENTKANELARLASSPEADLGETKVEYLPEASITPDRGIEVNEVDLGPS